MCGRTFLGASVHRRIQCLDGGHSCAHQLITVQLKVTHDLQALVDSSRRLRLPFGISVQPPTPSRIWVLGAAVPRHLYRKQSSWDLRATLVSVCAHTPSATCKVSRTLARQASTLSCCSFSSKLSQHLLRTLQEVASGSTSRHSARRLVALEGFDTFHCHSLRAQDAGLLQRLFVIAAMKAEQSDLWASHKVRRH